MGMCGVQKNNLSQNSPTTVIQSKVFLGYSITNWDAKLYKAEEVINYSLSGFTGGLSGKAEKTEKGIKWKNCL